MSPRGVFVLARTVLTVVTFRASSEVERQKWVTALELAKAKAIQVTRDI